MPNKRFDLFVHGEPTEFTGEWRHVGNFEAPNAISAKGVALAYMRHTDVSRVRVFTGGRMIFDSKEAVTNVQLQ